MIYPSSQQPTRVIPKDFADALKHWRKEGLETIFNAIWNGYSDLLTDPDIDLNWNNENQITDRLVRRVRDAFWPEASFFGITTQSGVEETRKSKRGLSPTPDVTIYTNDRKQMVELHIEAKIIRNDHDTTPYLAEISGNFCTGRYCPRSSIGGLFAYHQGDAATFPAQIAMLTGEPLTQLLRFAPHLHFESEHPRSGHHVKIGTKTIFLHHFIMPIP